LILTIMKLLILAVFLASCSALAQEIPTPWTAYEYQIGENQYIAFTANSKHFYTSWYSSDERGAGVLPNLICSGTYEFDGANLTLKYRKSGKQITYQVSDAGAGEFSMSSGGKVDTWLRTKLNDYIK